MIKWLEWKAFGKDYFDELLEKIREIRVSRKNPQKMDKIIYKQKNK
ncbi:hypothetical protein [Clostridium sp.]